MAGTGAISGKDASITYANGYVAKCTAWTLDVAVEDVDTTALGDDWRTRTWGVQEWSGTFTCQIDTATFGSSTNPTAIGIGIGASEGIFIYDDTSTDGSFKGNIMITGVSNTVSVGGGAATATFTFVGSGALTLTIAATA